MRRVSSAGFEAAPSRPSPSSKSAGPRAVAAALVAFLALASPARSVANGRFPAGGYFVAGGPDGRVMVLRTTFGLVVSRDGGGSWSWVCEEAFGAAGTYDAAVAIAASGRIVVTTPRGLAASDEGCVWAAPTGSVPRPLVDVAVDGAGRRLVALLGPSGLDDGLLRSDDGGRSWSPGATFPGLFGSTVEVAPGAPSRVYVSGFLLDGTPVLYRSDDGGATAREVARAEAFRGGASALVSGVDPRSPDVVYVRAAAGLGTALLRSDDGGSSFRELVRTAAPMTGFALSDDGRTVWVGSADPAEGIARSVDGAPFARLPPRVTVRCLRQRAGALFVCTDESADGYLLGRSTDGGEHLAPLVSARRLAGPSPACAAGSAVTDRCVPAWPAQRDALAAIDAGAAPFPEAGLDAGADADAATPPEVAFDSPRFDASPPEVLGLDAPPPDAARPAAATGAGCACATARPARARRPWQALGLALLGCARRALRGRRARARSA
jgi:photosystem II stability/assembly factor-like uncharacterized protein